MEKAKSDITFNESKLEDGNYASCDFCGLSFSHIHREGSLPKEFERIQEKAKLESSEAPIHTKNVRDINPILPMTNAKAYRAGIYLGDEDFLEGVDKGDLFIFLRDTPENRKLQCELLLKGLNH